MFDTLLTLKLKHGRRLKQFLTHKSINGSTWLLVHWWFGLYACSMLYLAVHFKIAVFPNIDSVYRMDFRRRILLSTIVSDSFNSKELWLIFSPFSGAHLCNDCRLPLDCWIIFRNYQVAVTQMKQWFESLLRRHTIAFHEAAHFHIWIYIDSTYFKMIRMLSVDPHALTLVEFSHTNVFRDVI